MSQIAPTILGSRYFDTQDQELFARLSGDVNPIHVDALAARRSIVGAVVVHGLHTVLWSLEKLAEASVCPDDFGALDVRFPGPVYLGEEVQLLMQSDKGSEIRLNAMVGTRTVALIRITIQRLPRSAHDIQDGMLLPGTVPQDIPFGDLASQHGTVPYAVKVADFATAFPAAAARFGAPLLRDLAACSRLVGMHCPGLRSVFSRLTLTRRQSGAWGPLQYHVVKTDSRFSIATIAVHGAAVSGTLQAFSPQPPPPQLTMSELAQRVGSADFAGQTALIVGGSRGLGELTAKAIAAGGGRTLITYAVGRKEAERVVQEIREFGREARCLPYDVTQPPSDQSTALGAGRPTHVYYYATCQIFQAGTLAFDAALLKRFMTFYVHGFHAVLQALWHGGARDLACFYPSSIAVEVRPKGMTEYTMAKAAGEILAADLGLLFPGYRSHQLRLPRLLTDQTVQVLPQELPQAIDILLPVLQTMQRQ